MGAVRVGLIGYGYWGPNLSRNLQEIEGFTLSAISDTDTMRLKAAARRFPTVLLENTPEQVVQNPDLDAIVIATPATTHYEIARAALSNGKHVLTAKPLTHSVATATALANVAAEANLVLMVDHTFVYTGAVEEIRNRVKGGDIGQIYHFDSTRLNLGLVQSDINVAWDLAAHDISILLHVVNYRPVSVLSVGSKHVGQQDDTAYIIVKFEGGMLAHISVSWLSPVKVRRVMIGGSRKMIVYDDNEVLEKVRIYDAGVEIGQEAEAVHRMLVEYRRGDVYAPKLDSTEALQVECAHFLECIRTGSTPRTGARSAIDVLRVLEAASDSIKDGGREVAV